MGHALKSAFGISILLLPLTAEVHAESFYRGNELLTKCTDDKKSKKSMQESALCVGYIAGVLDQFDGQRSENNQKACLPSGVTLRQMKAVVVKYIRGNPEQLHFSAETLIVLSAKKAFAC